MCFIGAVALIGAVVLEFLECIVDLTDPFAAVKELAADFLLDGVPVLHRHEFLVEQSYHEPAFPAVVRQLAVFVFGLDQGSELSVDHPVVLSDEDDIKEEMTVC